MMRLSYRLYLWASAFNHHLPRRLTKAGLLAAAVMVLAGAIGSDIDQSVAFQAFALLLCLLLVSIGWIPFFRGRFTLRRELPRLASVDQPFRYRIEVRNGTTRRYRELELLEDLADPRPTFEEFVQLTRPPIPMRTFRLTASPRPRLEYRAALLKPVSLPPMGPKASVDAQVEIVPLRRGPLHFQGATVARRDPLGLVRSFVRVAAPQTVLVLPKRYPVPLLAFDGTRNYQPGGVSFASSIGESEEFVALRDYRPGDALRHIHWRSWARAGRPIVKEYQDEYFVRHALVLDTFVTPVQSDAFEEAISVAASFACTLETNESLLDLLFVGSKAFCFTTGRGLGQSEQVLEVLASVKPSREPDFQALSNIVMRHAPALSACICVFVNWDEPRCDLVRRLRALGLPLVVLIVPDAATEKKLRAQCPDEDLGPVHILKSGHIAQDLQALEGAVP